MTPFSAWSQSYTSRGLLAAQEAVSLAGGLLGAMPLERGRPTTTLRQLVEWRKKSSNDERIQLLALRNKSAILVVVFITQQSRARILLGRNHPSTGPFSPVSAQEAGNDTRLVFSPLAYELTSATRMQWHWAANPPFGGIDFIGQDQDQFQQELAIQAQAALNEVEHLFLVPPHLAKPTDVTAHWILQTPQFAHLGAVMRGWLRNAPPIITSVSVDSALLTESGKIKRPRVSITLAWGESGVSSAIGQDWLDDRLQARGCPWPLHSLVAQEQGFPTVSQFSIQHTTPYRATLASVRRSDLARASHHETLADIAAYQDALRW